MKLSGRGSLACFLASPSLRTPLLLPLLWLAWLPAVSALAAPLTAAAIPINTLGAVSGILAAGYFLMPAVGMKVTIFFGVLLNFIVAAVIILVNRGQRRFRRLKPGRPRSIAATPFSLRNRFGLPAAALAGFMLLLGVIPPWEKELMVSGVFFRPANLVTRTQDRDLSEITRDGELLYYKEGMNGVVSVTANGDERSLVINGKTDASNLSDMQTQILLGQIPALLHPEPASALVIGLGSGIEGPL